MFRCFDDNFNMPCPPAGARQQGLCLRCVVGEQECGGWWMRWEPVAHPEDDLFWGDKLLPVPHVLSQVLVE